VTLSLLPHIVSRLRKSPPSRRLVLDTLAVILRIAASLRCSQTSTP